MHPDRVRPQPTLDRATAPIATALRVIPDRKARGRRRVAEAVTALRAAPQSWERNGWRYTLDAEPWVKIAEKDIERAAAVYDLTVRDERGEVIFHDRIQAWDGTPVLVPDGTQREEIIDGVTVLLDNFREDPAEAARSDLEHTVRVVTKNGPWVKAKPGTVSTFYSSTADGYVFCDDATYASARAGTGPLTADNSATSLIAGQRFTGSYVVYQDFIGFDTSALSGQNISSAILSLSGSIDASTTDFIAEVTAVDYGGTVETSDFVPGASLGAAIATFDSVNYVDENYNDFAEVGTALQEAINKTGETYLCIASDRQRTNTAPTGDERVFFYSANQSGTTKDPKLVVTHAPAAIVVEPGTGSLTTATFAPTVLAPRVVTPGLLALATESFAPLLTADINVVPGTLATLLATFAPTVLAPRTVTPGTLAALLEAFAPSAVVGEVVKPGAGPELALSAFAATVLTPRSVTPGTLEVVTVAFAPLVAVGQIITPDTAGLLLAAFAPVILTPVVAAPGIGELVTARFAPTTRLDKYAILGTASLSLTAFAPDAAYTADVYLTPGPASLVIATFAPTAALLILAGKPPPGTGLWNRTPAPGIGIIRTAPPPGGGNRRP